MKYKVLTMVAGMLEATEQKGDKLIISNNPTLFDDIQSAMDAIVESRAAYLSAGKNKRTEFFIQPIFNYGRV